MPGRWGLLLLLAFLPLDWGVAVPHYGGSSPALKALLGEGQTLALPSGPITLWKTQPVVFQSEH